MDTLEKAIDRIKDKHTQDCMRICAKRKQYPKDCIVDGSLEKMVNYILMLEKKCAD